MLKNIEQVVEELGKKLPFKPETNVGDNILIARENENALVEVAFARVVSFAPEIRHRQEWWHVEMAILSIPLQRVTFIVNSEQLNGKEIFTVSGQKVFLKAINPAPPATEPNPEPRNPQKSFLTLVRTSVPPGQDNES
ncbi:MAG: hypothetical protein LBU69_04930 [Deltaproteobacteria bacterium]|jgi:hypothetical protein|nr:hypothetical protein [Deltaproteobacteria bacterium]